MVHSCLYVLFGAASHGAQHGNTARPRTPQRNTGYHVNGTACATPTPTTSQTGVHMLRPTDCGEAHYLPRRRSRSSFFLEREVFNFTGLRLFSSIT